MRYLKCESCGAIVKELVPCTCGDCGIQCCGKQMVETQLSNIETTGQVLTCSSCKAQVEVIKPCNCKDCGIQCCGEQMK